MPLSARFEQAFLYAAAAHARQVRKASGVPYLAHLMAVCALVLEHGGSEDEAIAALLHDAPEDQGGRPRLDDIRRRFGPAVADTVEGCTDTFEQPKPAWRPRKEAYLARLAGAPASVHLVSAADKLHNACSVLAAHHRIGPAVWSRFSGGKAGTLWYYNALLEAYERAGKAPPALLAELRRTVAALNERAATDGYLDGAPPAPGR
jgi:GTP pyrophosphokinase